MPRRPLSGLLVLALILAAPLVARADAAIPVPRRSAISADDVRPHIELLAGAEFRGRSGKDAGRAAEYIRRRFEELGLRPLFAGGSYFQEIPGIADEQGKLPIVGRNVGAWLPGSDPELRDEFVIVSAHHDHLGVRGGQIYYGADDNASGVSMMLEVARRLAAAEVAPRRSVAFVGFDLEERMLWGSRWFAAHPPWTLEQVTLFITADMIGRSLGDLPIPTVFVLGSEHAPALRKTLDAVGTPAGLEAARMGIDLVGTRSDYGAFRDQQVPFLFFSTGEHPDYHTPQDTPERIDYEKVARVSTLILNVCRHTADADEAPVWRDDPGLHLDEARALHRIAGLLLEADGGEKLTSLQRLLVSQARNRTAQILERGEMTAAERSGLVRLAQLMLLSVF
jgi:hypothetical protein